MVHGVELQRLSEISGRPNVPPAMVKHLKLERTECPEMSVTSCQPTPRNIPEEQWTQLDGGGSLESREK